MRASARIAAFTAGLALVFALALAVGQAAGPMLKIDRTGDHAEMSAESSA